jgi:hypothetical protein
MIVTGRKAYEPVFVPLIGVKQPTKTIFYTGVL